MMIRSKDYETVGSGTLRYLGMVRFEQLSIL